ncbi:classical arabinogalactan protein 1-like [Forsythia ovata]|uniref:Classical arabinogalactan protein 1-like n=1 Tax=Forsythia ovata TaxID=205694 RepID=A0ABD1XCY3_9LAMI
MAICIQILSVLFFAFIFFIHLVFSTDPLENFPSPSPNLPTDALSLPVISLATPSQSPSPAHFPLLSSPPAPLPSDLFPISSPAPSPATTDSSAPNKSLTPAPAPAVSDNTGHDEANASNIETKRDSSSNRMNGGQKADVAVVVVAGTCIVGRGTRSTAHLFNLINMVNPTKTHWALKVCIVHLYEVPTNGNADETFSLEFVCHDK